MPTKGFALADLDQYNLGLVKWQYSEGCWVNIEEMSDREELREFLMRDKLANAYLLGNLDPSYFQFCRWFGARQADGSIKNIALLIPD